MLGKLKQTPNVSRKAYFDDRNNVTRVSARLLDGVLQGSKAKLCMEPFPSAESRDDSLRAIREAMDVLKKEQVAKVCRRLRGQLRTTLMHFNHGVCGIYDGETENWGPSVSSTATVVIDSNSVNNGVVYVVVRNGCKGDVPPECGRLVNEYVQGELKTELTDAGYSVFSQMCGPEAWKTSITFPIRQ